MSDLVLALWVTIICLSWLVGVLRGRTKWQAGRIEELEHLLESAESGASDDN